MKSDKIKTLYGDIKHKLCTLHSVDVIIEDDNIKIIIMLMHGWGLYEIVEYMWNENQYDMEDLIFTLEKYKSIHNCTLTNYIEALMFYMDDLPNPLESAKQYLIINCKFFKISFARIREIENL